VNGRVSAAVGAVVAAELPSDVAIGDVVHVGPLGLLGEVIGLAGGIATIQVYEETEGLEVGDPVATSGSPLDALLGPGLLGATFDGLQRPLDALASAGVWRLTPGLGRAVGTDLPGPGREVAPGRSGAAGVPIPPLREAPLAALPRDQVWPFAAERRPGDVVGPGDVLGTVPEGPLRHRILVPPDAPAGRLLQLRDGIFTVVDEIGRLIGPEGEVALRLAHRWPVRTRRPVARRLPAERPFVTGQRVLDMLYPVAVGGTAVIPGGFGTGKTVVEQALARWSDADVVVYVGCGERGNEMAELLATFPELTDPRTGGPLLARTVLIANTSNMPVAAREASIQLGITIAEYFRDQGLSVALLADSTSRWAEALREISGRLEELPGEEGFPAYLASRLAAFYEAAGRARVLGTPAREGAVTLIGAVSPPGGDFSEPVTQASLRLAGTFWSLDAELAHARHFPAISWERSYSLVAGALAGWYAREVDPAWAELRADLLAVLARERSILDVVQLVGADALPEVDRAILVAARLIREVFLQQHALDAHDAARPLAEQVALLRAVLAARDALLRWTEAGRPLGEAAADARLGELGEAKGWTGPGTAARLLELAGRLGVEDEAGTEVAT
jgi:V/A-type H+/Na+-transporting ATPase subunit A